MKHTLTALGAGILLMAASMGAQAHDNDGFWWGLSLGVPLGSMWAPAYQPPVVVVPQPAYRVYGGGEYDQGWHRRAWLRHRRHEWREHHRWHDEGGWRGRGWGHGWRYGDDD